MKVSPEQRAELRALLTVNCSFITLGRTFYKYGRGLLDDLEALEAQILSFPFKLGDRVQAAQTYKFYDDWRGAEIYVAGVIQNGDKSLNIFTRSPREGLTDGWSPEDLEMWVELI